MARKGLVLIGITLFAVGTSLAPAQAATVKSGMSCTKVNATTKVKFQGDTYVYKCVKNPMYKKTRLTWTLQECLSAIKDYKDALASVNATKAAGGTPTETDNQLLSMAKDLRNMSCQAGI